MNREGLKRLWDRFGDPGDVAYEAKVRSRTPWYLFVSLTVGAPVQSTDTYSAGAVTCSQAVCAACDDRADKGFRGREDQG